MPTRSNKESKPCAVCGRKIEWRKKWEKSWNEIKYCSDRCRKATSSARTRGALYESRILEILESRARGLTMWPSEVLESLDKQNPELMEQVREAARRLVAKGRLEIVQRGKAVDPSQFKGPIRLRLPR